MYRIFGLLAAALVVVSCATTTEQSLDTLHVGMDKDDVLKTSGSPWISRRVKSEDLWIYRYYRENQEYRKELRFKNGLVTAVGLDRAYPDVNNEIEDAENMDDFKKAAEKKNQSYKDGFKEVPAPDSE